jgi:tetratricopeptide (TPR) repeat protein
MRVGRVQGVPISANLGQTENAETNLQLAEGLIASVLQAQPRNRMAALRMAQILHDRMVLAQARRPDTAALPLAERSHEWWDRYLDGGPVDANEKAQVAIVGVNVANWLGQRDRVDAADKMLRRTIDVARATGQPNYVGSAYITLTHMRRNAGDLDGALASSTDAVRLLQAAAAVKDRGRIHAFALALEAKGEVLAATGIGFGRNAEAAVFFAQCVQLAEAEARQDPSDVSSRSLLTSCALKLGNSLLASDPQRALAAFVDGLSRSAEIKNSARARRRDVRLLAGSAAALRGLRRLPEARTRLDAAFARLSELKTYPAPAIEPGSETFELLRELAEWHGASGDARQAIAVYTELQQKLEKAGSAPESELADAVDLTSLLNAQARLHRAASQPELAAALDRRRQELRALWRQKKPANLFVQKIWD